MDAKTNKVQNTEEFRITNIVGETKKYILDKKNNRKGVKSGEVSDDEIQQAVERINPDPNSMKNWG